MAVAIIGTENNMVDSLDIVASAKEANKILDKFSEENKNEEELLASEDEASYIDSYGVRVGLQIFPVPNFYIVREFNIWEEWSSQVVFGVFTSKHKAIEAIKKAYTFKLEELKGQDRWEIYKPISCECESCGFAEDIDTELPDSCPECGEKLRVEYEKVGVVTLTEVTPNVFEEV